MNTHILQEIITLLNEFNKDNLVDFEIDTIRIKFNKRCKLEKLQKLGNWHKINSNNPLIAKLKDRLSAKQITSAFQLENEPIYYCNIPDRPKYNKAQMVIFGLCQYHKDPPNINKVSQIASTLKDISSIDLCVDFEAKPNIDNLSEYEVVQYVDTNSKLPTDTYYINRTNILMVDKVCIYNKAIKNKLGFSVNRFEATIQIPNSKYLALPLYELNKLFQKVLQ
ncbi:MAG: hypothetical protein ACK5LP_00930 [Campylobacteraceae bacterium]